MNTRLRYVRLHGKIQKSFRIMKRYRNIHNDQISYNDIHLLNNNDCFGLRNMIALSALCVTSINALNAQT